LVLFWSIFFRSSYKDCIYFSRVWILLFKLIYLFISYLMALFNIFISYSFSLFSLFFSSVFYLNWFFKVTRVKIFIIDSFKIIKIFFSFYYLILPSKIYFLGFIHLVYIILDNFFIENQIIVRLNRSIVFWNYQLF
jgi:hypothetical protein